MILVDYLILMIVEKVDCNDFVYGMIIKGLKNFVKEFDCVVVFLMQFNCVLEN